MKKLYIISIACLSLLMFPSISSAKTEKYQTSLYNCDLGKPDKTEYLWYRYPTEKKPKRDKKDNNKVHLIWEDIGRAHSIEIKITKKGKHVKTIVTNDDAQHVIKGLKNSKKYTFKIRGISNCGKGHWSTSLKVFP